MRCPNIPLTTSDKHHGDDGVGGGSGGVGGSSGGVGGSI